MAYAISLGAGARDVEQPALDRLLQSYTDRREYLSTRRQLDALSDRQLADIGLSRANVEEVSRAAVYGA